MSKILFRWDEIPGKDDEKFIEYLMEYFRVGWVKKEQIEKIDNDMAIRVFTEENSLLLRLNNEKTKAILTINDGSTSELTVKSEDGKLNIYPESITIKILEIYNILKSVFVEAIAILTTIYILFQFSAILGIIPEPYGILEPIRTFTLLIAFIILAFSIGYKINDSNKKYRVEVISKLNEISKNLKGKKKYDEPKNPSIPINENLGYNDVEFAIYYLTKQMVEDNFFEKKDLFCWNNIPGDDEEQFRKFFRKYLPQGFVNYNIYKDGNKIIVSRRGVTGSITLSDNQTIAKLKIGSKSYDFPVKEEGEKHYIYEYDSEKNLIIGVDRGGAVMGGMLAKNFGLAVKVLAVGYANPPQREEGITTSISSEICLNDIKFEKVKKILLVDDAIRTGKVMHAGESMLYKKLENEINSKQIEVRIACILNQEQVHVRPFEIYYSVYNTPVGILLPWDKMHLSDGMKLKQDEKEVYEKLTRKIKTNGNTESKED